MKKAKNIAVKVAAAGKPEKVPVLKKCRAFEVGHKSCPCGREGCAGNLIGRR